MKINELASLDKMIEVAHQQGLSYNDDNIKSVEQDVIVNERKKSPFLDFIDFAKIKNLYIKLSCNIVIIKVKKTSHCYMLQCQFGIQSSLSKNNFL